MDKQTALDFLRLHQPMPAQLSDQLVAEFRAVREFLRDNPCDEALEPLLRSLNEGDGAGEYGRSEHGQRSAILGDAF